MTENRGRQYQWFIQNVFYVFSEFVYGGLCFFSLKPSPSLKISAHQDLPFRRSQGTNKHTDSLTDKCFYIVIYYFMKPIYLHRVHDYVELKFCIIFNIYDFLWNKRGLVTLHNAIYNLTLANTDEFGFSIKSHKHF